MPQPSAASYPNVLSLHQLKLPVRLGVGEEERAKPQDVLVDVSFYLPGAIAAASDDNAEYICYHDISQKIHALCTAREYRLIEFLVHEIYRLMRTLVPPDVKIRIDLRKPNIMLDYVTGGASYSFTDLPAGKGE